MDFNSLFTDLDLRLEVLIVLLNSNTVLKPDGCYLDRVIVLEASRLCVQCIKVGLVKLLEILLSILIFSPLSLLLTLIHLAEAEALLPSGIVSCLRFLLAFFALRR